MTKSYVTVRSEIGDPIQLSDLRPVACETLVRIGSPNDGGYVVPLDAVKTAGALLSFGLAHNWTFEQGFKKHNAGAIIHGYDHTVSFPHGAGVFVRPVAARDRPVERRPSGQGFCVDRLQAVLSGGQSSFQTANLACPAGQQRHR